MFTLIENNPILSITILLDFLGFIGAAIKCHNSNITGERFTLFMVLGVGFFWLLTTDLSFLLTGDTRITPLLYLTIRAIFVTPVWLEVFKEKKWGKL